MISGISSHVSLVLPWDICGGLTVGGLEIHIIKHFFILLLRKLIYFLTDIYAYNQLCRLANGEYKYLFM